MAYHYSQTYSMRHSRFASEWRAVKSPNPLAFNARQSRANLGITHVESLFAGYITWTVFNRSVKTKTIALCSCLLFGLVA